MPTVLSRLVRLPLGPVLAAALGASLLSGCDDPPINLVSDEQVEQVGLESWRQLKAQTPVSRDSAKQARLARIAEQVLRAEGQNPADWEAVVFATDDVNAFALPGRKIGVFEGMMDLASDDAQLAAIVGHEVGHLMADHSQERMNAYLAAEFGLGAIALVLSLAEVEYAREIAAVLGVGVEYGLVRPYSRDQELEADRLGLFAMSKAGYDPAAAVTLWQRMDQASRGAPPEFLSTHPAPGSRIQAIEEMLPEARRAGRER